MDDATLVRYRQVRFNSVLVVLWIAYTAYAMMRRPFSVARADIEKETGLTAAELSWVDTAYMLTYCVCQIFYAALKRHFSYSQILLMGLSGAALSCVMLAVSHHILLFVVAWALNGLAQGTGWSSCIALLNSWVFPDERGTVMGVWSTSMAAGGVIGNVLPSYLIGHGLSWRTATLIEVVVGPLAAGLLTAAKLKTNPNRCGFPSVQQIASGMTMTQMQEMPKIGLNLDDEYIFASVGSTDNPVDVTAKDDAAMGGSATGSVGAGGGSPSSGPSTNAPTAPPSPSSHGSRTAAPSTWAILHLPGIAGFSWSYFLHKLVRYSFMFWLPYYLNKEIHASTEAAGYIASAFDVGGVAGIVVSGYLSDRLFGGQRRILVLLICTGAMAVATLAMALLSSLFVSHVTLCTVVVFMVGLFSFAIDALQSGTCLVGYCNSIGAPVGAVCGVVGGIGSLGAVVQGVFTVALSSSSWGVLFLTFSVATVIAGVLMMRPFMAENAEVTKKH